jgi:hypothetical protein
MRIAGDFVVSRSSSQRAAADTLPDRPGPAIAMLRAAYPVAGGR